MSQFKNTHAPPPPPYSICTKYCDKCNSNSQTLKKYKFKP